MQVKGVIEQMAWLYKMESSCRKGGSIEDLPAFVPVASSAADDDMRERVNTLTPDELEIYTWLREGYTQKWIVETLYKGHSEILTCAKRVYHKLGVKDRHSLVNMYAVLDKDVMKIDISRDPHGLFHMIFVRLDDLRVFFRKESKIVLFPDYWQISIYTSEEEKRDRVNSLAPAELEMYKWLREGYTLEWVAETLFISKKRARRYEKNVYRKLGVIDQYGLFRLYGFLDKERPEVVKLSTLDDEE